MHTIVLNNDMGQTYGVSSFPKTIAFLDIIVSILCPQKEPQNYSGQTHSFS